MLKRRNRVFMKDPEDSREGGMLHSKGFSASSLSAGAYFLVGPTAVGKTAVAQWIAEKLVWPVLSADAMLVYKGMDVGTAKPGFFDREKVSYYGMDLVTPDIEFNVWAYRNYTREILMESGFFPGRESFLRQCLIESIIVVGGTGLYLKSLTDGLSDLPAPDPVLRQNWNRILEEQGVAPLQHALRSKSPELFCSLADVQNGRRLIRALELAEQGGRAGCCTWKRGKSNVCVTGLEMSKTDLDARIVSRVQRMYSNGLLDEVQDLLEKYSVLSRTARQAIGYSEAIECLEGRCSEDEAVARTARRTRQLAKRQRTWFRHQANVRWIKIDGSMEPAEVGKMVIDDWRKHGPAEIFR